MQRPTTALLVQQLVLLVALAVTPAFVSAASLIPCATSSNPTMCSLCDVFVTGNTIVNYFSGILLPLALVALTFGGILYLMNRVDQAKSIITASVLGIILSLSAFLIVNLTMRAMNVPQTDWNTFTCTAQVAATPPKTDGTTFNTTGDGGPKDTVGNPGDITGDPTVTPTTPICNENRDTSSIPMTLPLSLTLNCTNPDQIVSAIWRFPSDSNFGSQTVDNKTGITFTSIDNPSNWTEVTVVVTDTKGRTQTYTYGFGGGTVVDAGEIPRDCSGITVFPLKDTQFPVPSVIDFTGPSNFPARNMVTSGSGISGTANGGNPLYVMKIQVDPGDSTKNNRAPASINYGPEDVSGYLNHRISVSKRCGSFESGAQVLSMGPSGGAFTLRTPDDTRSTTAVLSSPGVWYINIEILPRNDGNNYQWSFFWKKWQD